MILICVVARDGEARERRTARRLVLLPLYVALTLTSVYCYFTSVRMPELCLRADSGHGDQKKDTDRDETDGYDECACPSLLSPSTHFPILLLAIYSQTFLTHHS